MMDKLTQKSQEALKAAEELARERSHQELDGAHLALALARRYSAESSSETRSPEQTSHCTSRW